MIITIFWDNVKTSFDVLFIGIIMDFHQISASLIQKLIKGVFKGVSGRWYDLISKHFLFYVTFEVSEVLKHIV